MYDQAEKTYNQMAMQAGANAISKDGPVTEEVHRINKTIEGMGNALAELESRLSPILLACPPTGPGPTAVPTANCRIHAQLSEIAQKAAIQRQSLHELIGRIQL